MSEKIQQEAKNKSTVLPPLYKSITPLFSKTHKKMQMEPRKDYAFAADATGIVLAAEEFPAAERDYPIVFSCGERVMPVALTGVPGGRNQFISANGMWKAGAYVPAYIRRYPFILAKLRPEAKDLTLCFDPDSGLIAEGREGDFFAGDEPSGRTKAILQLCEWYEAAIAKTETFVGELKRLDLLMDAEANIRFAGQEPAVFRGFKIVSEEKFKQLADPEMRMLVKSGALALIHAHLFSLKNIERLFARDSAGTPDIPGRAGKTKAA